MQYLYDIKIEERQSATRAASMATAHRRAVKMAREIANTLRRPVTITIHRRGSDLPPHREEIAASLRTYMSTAIVEQPANDQVPATAQGFHKEEIAW